ncbi:FecR domain-containing protein [Candidatus Riflebacteria bacterium]
MKKKFFFLLFCVMLLLLQVPLEAVEQRIRLRYFEGKVKVYQRKFEKWNPAERKMPLNFGDRIKTEGGSKAVISFSGKNELLVEENSELELKSPPGKRNRIVLFFGNVFARFRKVLNRGNFEVHTSDLVAGVKGTELHVGVNKNGVSTVACTYHSTYVVDKNDNRRIVLPKNRIMRYKVGEKIKYARFQSKELLGLWEDSLESYYSEVAEAILSDAAPVPQQVETFTSMEREHFVGLHLKESFEQFEKYEDEVDKTYVEFYDLFEEIENDHQMENWSDNTNNENTNTNETDNWNPDGKIDYRGKLRRNNRIRAAVDRRIRNTLRIFATYKSIQNNYQKCKRFYRKLIFLIGRDDTDPLFIEFKKRFLELEKKFHRTSRTFNELRNVSRNIREQLDTISLGNPVQ